MCVSPFIPSIAPSLADWRVETKQKGQHVIVLTDAILAQKEKQKERQRAKGGYRKLNPENLQWKPPVFSAASRTWNW